MLSLSAIPQSILMETSHFKLTKWLNISVINFLITALAGIILRYQTNFPLPAINHIYLMHSHSHFAFTGWISMALMALMVSYLAGQNQQINYKKYEWILIANSVSAYGMLVTFVFQGYALYSITFSTLSIFVSYAFIYVYWKDLRKINDKSAVSAWFKTGLVLCGISSLGAFTLAFLMAKHIHVQEYNLAAIYFYLHFQYNGWFIFVVFGLLFAYLDRKHSITLPQINRNLYLLLVLTVVPGYLLSLIGMDILSRFRWVGGVSGVIQFGAFYYFIKLFIAVKDTLVIKLSKATRYLWTLASVSFLLKLTLQMLSVIPYFSDYATGFRPIAIAYLHLIFLGIISFFIIGYINEYLKEQGRFLNLKGTYIFITGVVMQEIILMMEGMNAMGGFQLPYANFLLLLSAITIGSGIAFIVFTKKAFSYGACLIDVDNQAL